MHLSVDIPVAARPILSQLAAAGGEVYLVGGIVRDALLGLATSDFDVATPLRPEVLKTLFPSAELCFGGLSFQTAGLDFTITSFRRDGTYGDQRHPDSIEYVSSVEADAQRRDFTVNAIYLDPATGVVLDPVAVSPTSRHGRSE